MYVLSPLSHIQPRYMHAIPNHMCLMVGKKKEVEEKMKMKKHRTIITKKKN
jgi:hypothetical protein